MNVETFPAATRTYSDVLGTLQRVDKVDPDQPRGAFGALCLLDLAGQIDVARVGIHRPRDSNLAFLFRDAMRHWAC